MRFLILIITITLVVSCKKKVNTPVQSSGTKLERCILVLNEGLFQQNNAHLSMIDLDSLEINNLFFEEKTGRPLGDTGNDMQVYDGKIFIVVNVSSTLEILDEKTGASIKQISMVENGIPKQPRYITFNANKAYISCYDGYVDVLDLTLLTLTNRIKVGANPEQLAIANNKLYVANSGGLNFPNVDSTVSVVSLSSELEINKIVVGKNPGPIVVDNQNDVYVISRGNYGSIPSRMHRISSASDSKIQSFPFDASGFCKMKSDLLISYVDGAMNKILKFDTQNETVVSVNFVDVSSISTFYGMQYSTWNDKLYFFDANGYVNAGYVLEYDSNGSYVRKFNVGLIPNKVVVYE
jgi:hypothetical protein